MSSLCENGRVVQLRRKKVSPAIAVATNPNNKGCLQHENRQEILPADQQESRYSDDQYSDKGYPSLPRPKTILSLSRSSLPWSIHQASKLCTLPVRARRVRRSEFEKQLHSVCVDAAASPVKASTEFTYLNSASKRFSLLSGNPDRSSSCFEEPVRQCRSNSISGAVVAEMNSHKLMKSKKGQASTGACGVEESVAQGEQQKSKKPRKPSKALSFSFGSGSDLKRRTLGFLGRGEKKRSSPVTPDSPILVSRKDKSKTLHVMSAAEKTVSREVVHPKSNGSMHTVVYGSYQDIHSARSPAKPRPPPLQDLSSSLGHQQQLYHGVEGESPQAKSSPSSSQSSESPPFDSIGGETSLPETGKTVSTSPPSRRQSPKYSRPRGTLSHHVSAPNTATSRVGRKLSDPMLPSAPSAGHSPRTSPGTHRSTLKKRNTFCVRPSRLNVDEEQEWKEMRQHVVRFLVETEQSYVESLKVILKVYYEPLKRPQAVALAEPALVKDIFFQIPEICSLHERFLLQLTERVEHWDAEKKIGDILVNTFSKCQLMDIYTKFIGNFMRARASIELAKQAKSVFSKFLEQRTRINEGKLTLDDLLIKPVQRIPRYVLFIKDLLKHTAPTHPDHAPLQQALGELTMLAERVNDSERERERVGHHKELLGAVDGLTQILSPSSRFISYNMVTELKGHMHKRDRFLILFSDILVCASSRRKSSSFKRSSLLNLNSVFSDGLKYNIKWHVPLTKTSVAQIQTPYVDRCKQNTLEKMMEHLHKDEAILQEMLDMSSRLHHPRQALVATLKELQAELREGVASKKAEFDDLPPECTRIDLISYASAPPAQYTLLFPSHRIRQSWEQGFLQVKEAADCQAPPSTSIAPPTSPLPVQAHSHQELTFVNSMILQSVRSGMQLTCAAEGLAVDSASSSCLWVCCSDGLGGQVSLLSLHPSAMPQIAANITLSDSRITCITAVPTPPVTAPSSRHEHLPDIAINSISSSSSSDHVTLSPTSSFTSDVKSMPGDKDDDMLFIDGELELTSSVNVPSQQFSSSLTVREFARVRSNSAPPIPDSTLQEEAAQARVPSPATGQQSTLSAQSGVADSSDCSRKTPVWSALTLRPSSLEGCGRKERDHSMWLGTEAGELHVYRVGDNLRYRKNRVTVELSAAVLCIQHLNGAVYAGLANGTVVVLDARDPAASRHSVMVGGGAVRNCLDVMEELWVSCEGSLYQMDISRHTLRVVCTLPGNHHIAAAHATGNGVWLSVQNSPILYLVHAPSGVQLASIDCTHAVSQPLKVCDPFTRQRKGSSLQITSLHSSPSHLLVGTNAGVVLAITLPFIEPSLEPHPLPHPPILTPLYHGHVDSVHFSLVLQKEGGPLVITGGTGHHDFSQNRNSTQEKYIPDTASCLLLWR